MENYHFGNHLPFKKVLENKSYYAKLFAEGNDDLKRLLLYCFDNNIETYMCCIGHYDDEEEVHQAFIVFNIPYSCKDVIYSIVSSVYDLEEVAIRLGKKYMADEIEVYIKSYYGIRFFNNIYKGFKNSNQQEKVTPEMVKVVELLNAFNHHPYDFYFESVWENGRTSYQTWVDYIYEIDPTTGSRHRSRYVFNDHLFSSNIKQCFTETSLCDYAKKIKNS